MYKSKAYTPFLWMIPLLAPLTAKATAQEFNLILYGGLSLAGQQLLLGGPAAPSTTTPSVSSSPPRQFPYASDTHHSPLVVSPSLAPPPGLLLQGLASSEARFDMPSCDDPPACPQVQQREQIALHAEDSQGNTAFDHAIVKGDQERIRHLYQIGAWMGSGQLQRVQEIHARARDMEAAHEDAKIQRQLAASQQAQQQREAQQEARKKECKFLQEKLKRENRAFEHTQQQLAKVEAQLAKQEAEERKRQRKEAAAIAAIEAQLAKQGVKKQQLEASNKRMAQKLEVSKKELK